MWTLYDWVKFRNELHIHLPRKRMGSKGMLLWPPQNGSSFFVPSNERRRSDLFLGPKTPRGRNTHGEIFFLKGHLDGVTILQTQTAHDFFGGKSLQNRFWHQIWFPPQKRWHFMMPRVSQTGSSKCILTRTSKTTMFAGSVLPKMFFSPTHHRLA